MATPPMPPGRKAPATRPNIPKAPQLRPGPPLRPPLRPPIPLAPAAAASAASTGQKHVEYFTGQSQECTSVLQRTLKVMVEVESPIILSNNRLERPYKATITNRSPEVIMMIFEPVIGENMPDVRYQQTYVQLDPAESFEQILWLQSPYAHTGLFALKFYFRDLLGKVSSNYQVAVMIQDRKKFIRNWPMGAIPFSIK